MWCCCGDSRPQYYEDEDPQPQKGNAGTNASNGKLINTNISNRRDSQDSDIFFDCVDFDDETDNKDKAASVDKLGHLVDLAAPRKSADETAPAPGAADGDSVSLTRTEETRALNEIREMFAEKGRLKDQAYCRFLRARQWDVKKAAKLIERYLDFRSKMQPERIQWTEIEEEFRTGKVFRLSLEDFKQRHVVILRPGKQNTKNHDQQMKQLVYTMESVIALKPEESEKQMEVAPKVTPASEQLIVLLDFTGYTLRNAPPFKTSLETLKILQDYYCERLGEALLLNPPSVFRVLWKLIRPFIDKRTLKKINFLPKDYKKCDLLKERFDLELLDESLGGTGNCPYEHESYGAMMMEEDKKRLAALGTNNPYPSESNGKEEEEKEGM